jgi:hypothetical protein
MFITEPDRQQAWADVLDTDLRPLLTFRSPADTLATGELQVATAWELQGIMQK